MSATQVFTPFSSETSSFGYFEAKQFIICQFFLVFKVKDFRFDFHGSGTF